MRILFYEWENFGTIDMKEAFENAGHSVVLKKTNQEQLLTDCQNRIKKEARETTPDLVYTFNYFPEVAKACADIGLDYYSWVYDNPAVSLYSCTVILPTNHIFVFDSDTFLLFNSQGIKTINFLPMAASPKRLQKLVGSKELVSDISFVGSLYTEKHDFFGRMKPSKYVEGYLAGIIEAQKKIYGDNIVRRLLSKEIINDMYKSLPLEPEDDSTATKEYLYSDYVINRKITALERVEALSALGEKYKVDLYTPDRSKAIPGCVNHGPSEFFEGTPKVFAQSRINLNITLRSIVNGIPLRCFEIMGSGGFLLSNYQGDLADLFKPDEEFVYYDSKEDMMNKVSYYLSHEDERREIASLGLSAIIKGHTFDHRVKEMFGEK